MSDNLGVLPFFSNHISYFSSSLAVLMALMFSLNRLLNLPFDDLAQFPSRLYSKNETPQKIRENLIKIWNIFSCLS